jgi:hypothetical protein
LKFAMSRQQGLLVTAVTIMFSWSGSAHAQVDLGGIWTPTNQPGLGPTRDADIHLTPAGQTEFERFGTDDDRAFKCAMPGIPKGFVDPYPIEILMQDSQIVFLYEYFHQVRRIFMDGREAPEYWPMTLGGYSTGTWEGETLVVRTTHLSPDNDMDPRGHPFSGADDTYVIERYTRVEDELSLVAEIHDPIYYSEPYPVRWLWGYTPNGEIWEYECDPEFGSVD